jgi:2-polyprenyl-6-methoxyphenol hydroxylase-like FAD-dependent oxidoreductase
MREVSVIISGGGSVGLSLSAELGWRGIDCMVVEQADGLNAHPRANAVANRTMEYYRRWGIDKVITEAGIPPDHPADYYWISSLHGRQLHRISLPPFKKIREVKDTGGYVKEEHTWSPYLKTITGQNEVEEAILNYINSLPNISMNFSCSLETFNQDSSGVTCKIKNIKTGKIEEVRSKYLVACDGGKSSVREKLNIGLSGRADMARFVSIYFKSPDFMNCHKFGAANIFFPLHKDYAGFLLNWDGGTTFTYHLMLKDEQIWNEVDAKASIEAVLGKPTDINIISVQPWTAHALVADKYHNNRVIMAGDAVHLFTPTGGFGMNTGVSDAIDIAWKIQGMIEGWGGNKLIDSYYDERHPIGVRNTKEAADCFDQLNAVMQYGDILDEDTERGDKLRKKLSVSLKEQDKLIASSGTLLGYRYNYSSIIISDGTVETIDNPRKYIPTARPGHRAPHIWLEEGISIYDKFSKNFTLLVFSEETKDAKNLILEAESINLPIKLLKVRDKDASHLYEKKYVIIRPDLMVAWRSDVIPKKPIDILYKIIGKK